MKRELAIGQIQASAAALTPPAAAPAWLIHPNAIISASARSLSSCPSLELRIASVLIEFTASRPDTIARAKRAIGLMVLKWQE